MAEDRLQTLARQAEEHMEHEHRVAGEEGFSPLGPQPSRGVIEAILTTAFWASLRREEGRSPRISVAFLEPEQASLPLLFSRRLPFTPETLSRLAPAVERPGIHLGVWKDSHGLYLWGATRTIPPLTFVLEVVDPGLLVVKHPRREGFGKFVNVAVLQGDQVKVVSDSASPIPAPVGLPGLAGNDLVNGISRLDVLVQLGTSMRAHGRGGALILVPSDSQAWRQSIVHPISYAVDPAYARLRDLLAAEPEESDRPVWRNSLRQAVEGIAGLTAVDGATLLTDQLELLAFGAKLGRRDGSRALEELLVTEPVADAVIERVHPLQLGGTRHLSAAQFVQDQPETLAMVASQDGRFTTFVWSPEEEMVSAHRVEVLLL